jgi:hypothetical protein
MEVFLRSPRFPPTSRFGAWLVGIAPELRLLMLIVGGFLVIGFMMGFDLPAP